MGPSPLPQGGRGRRAGRGGGGLFSGSVAEARNPAADFFWAGFQRRAVDDQPRAHHGDRLDLDQTIGLQSRTGLDEIDDVPADPQTWSKLDRTVELDAFGLDAARRKMAAGHLRVFCCDADMARPFDILSRWRIPRRRDREAAMTDIEVERSVNLRIVELHQHIIAGNAELRGAESNKGGGVKAAHPDQVEPGFTRLEAKLPRGCIVER